MIVKRRFGDWQLKYHCYLFSACTQAHKRVLNSCSYISVYKINLTNKSKIALYIGGLRTQHTAHRRLKMIHTIDVHNL